MLQSYLLLPHALLLKKDECSEKKRERRGNKKGQVPGNLRKEKKCETRGKNGQVFDSTIRGTRDPPE